MSKKTRERQRKREQERKGKIDKKRSKKEAGKIEKKQEDSLGLFLRYQTYGLPGFYTADGPAYVE